MFDDISRNLLRDVEHIALVTLVLGLVLNALWRYGLFGGRSAEAAGGEVRPQWGKVRSDLMSPLDLAMAFVVLAFYYLKFLPTEADKAGSSGVGEPSVDLILSHFLVTLFMLTFALSTIYWGGRRNPAEVFGLNLLSPLRCLGWVVMIAVPATAAVLGVHYMVSTLWLEPTFGEQQAQEAVTTLLTAKDPLVLTLLIFNACLVAPFAEEVLFRGYLYGVVKRYTGPLFSMVVTGLLFAVVHLNIPAVVPLWMFAVMLALAYEFTGSLWVPIGIHALFNTLNVAWMLSGRDLMM